MKTIVEYLNESKQNFLIKGHTKSQQDKIPEIPDLKYYSTTVNSVIKELDKFAKTKGFNKVRFKNKNDIRGIDREFTIFIYKPNEKRYCIGFDGSWDSKDLTFKHCTEEAYNYIIKNKM